MRGFCSKTLVLEAVGSIFMVSDPRNKENQAHSPPNNGFGDKIECQLPGHFWNASFCSKTLVWEAAGYIFMVSDFRNQENEGRSPPNNGFGDKIEFGMRGFAPKP